MTASSFDPATGAPIFDDADAPDVAQNPTEAAAFAGRVGTRLIGTTSERVAYAYAREGLRWYDTTVEGEFIHNGSGWVCGDAPRTEVVSRNISGTNTFVNQVPFADFPNADDAEAMLSSFVKRFGDTKLVIRIYASAQMSSGVSQNGTLGLRIGATDYDVAKRRFPTAPAREDFNNAIELNGIPAGTYAVKPRFRAGGASQFEWFTDDYLTYEITETV